MDSNRKENTNDEETGARDDDLGSRANCCFDIASIDADLLKIHVNTETLKSNRLLSEDERIPVACSSIARRSLKQAYLELARSYSIALLLLQYKHHIERGYGRFAVCSKKTKGHGHNSLD